MKVNEKISSKVMMLGKGEKTIIKNKNITQKDVASLNFSSSRVVARRRFVLIFINFPRDSFFLAGFFLGLYACAHPRGRRLWIMKLNFALIKSVICECFVRGRKSVGWDCSFFNKIHNFISTSILKHVKISGYKASHTCLINMPKFKTPTTTSNVIRLPITG